MFVKVCLGIFLLTLSLVVGGLGYQGYLLIQKANVVLGKAEGTVDNLNQTLVSINRLCGTKENGNLLPCGTLAQINKATVAVGDIAKTTQIQVKQSGQMLLASQRDLDSATSDIHIEMSSLTRTTNAATEFLQTTNDNLQPVLKHSDITVTDLDALLKQQAITDTFTNLDSFTLAASGSMKNVQDMTSDGKKVSDDLTKKYFAPVPWWKKIGPFTEFGVKVTNEVLPF